MDVNNAGENEPGAFHRFFHLLFRMINAFFASLMHAITDDDAGNETFESHALIDSSAFLANNRVNRRIRDDDVSFLELDQPTEVAQEHPPFGDLTKLGVDIRLMIYKYLPNEELKLEITPPSNKWERVDENPLISLGLTCRAAFDECRPVWEARSPSTLVNLVIHENDQARGVWQSVQSVLFPGVDKMSALDGTTTREQRSLAMFLDKDHPKTNAFLPKLPLATPVARLRVQIDSFPLCFTCAIANLIQSLDFGFGLTECTIVLPRRLPPGFLTYFRSLQFRPAVLEQLWLETVLCRCTIKFEVRRGWLAHYLTGAEDKRVAKIAGMTDDDLQKLKERLDEGPVLQASPATRAPASDDPRNHTRPRGLGRGCGPFWLPDEFFEDLDLIGTPAVPCTPPRQS